jgi:glycosyltransferase involved in cell wall biosynthesis
VNLPTLLYHGAFERLSSFTLVNRQLATGLRRKGWAVSVMPTDRPAPATRRLPRPDLYFFNGHPYDLIDAPGRVNVFNLPYDYSRFVPGDRLLAPTLNARFDRLVVPSRFTKASCERSGVRIPIDVCPHGVEPREIHPAAPPIAWPSRRGFRFLYLGGAYERKGTDLLLRAYLREFSARDDVCLLIKAFSYAHLQPWLKARMTALGVGRPGAPEIVYEYGNTPSVAGYYTAAHVGVFPFRGEGFGISILECLASGRPAIVTRGCGPLDFCREPFVRFLDARPARRAGREELEPDLASLRRLLRDAYRRGPIAPAEQLGIHASVAAFTWANAVERLDAVLRDAWARRGRRGAGRRPTPRPRGAASRSSRRVAYAFRETGQTSWRKVSLRIRTALRRRFVRFVALALPGPADPGRADVVVGQSGFCLEAFHAARDRNPDSRLILHTGSAPLEVSLRLTNAERARCGVAPLAAPPIQFWRHRHESDLADTIVVESSVSRNFFVRAGYPAGKLRVLPPGIDVPARRPPRRGRRERLRFLFVGTEPFRKGVRLLFQAWARARPRHAELICRANPEILTSRPLLRVMVARPDIVVTPAFLRRREFLALYEQVDCLVLPSLEDGFAFAVSEGMGRGIPAIVSTATGVRDLIVHGENGYVVESGSVSDLAGVLARVSDERDRLPALGEAALETARRYPWRRFEAGLAECVAGR